MGRTQYLILAFYVLVYLVNGCVKKYATCGCKNIKSKSSPGKRLYCHDVDVVSLFQDADFTDSIVLRSVDLSRNIISEISKATFGRNSNTLKILQGVSKLDFSNNDIWRIAPGAFSLFPNLTRLNLSRNSIGLLSKDMFSGLPKLEIMDLSFNKFPIIPGDVFSNLPKLKKLYVRSTGLVCNCLMRDFIVWLNQPDKTLLKVVGTCHLPMLLRGKTLKSRKPDSLLCDPNNTLTSLPYFEMLPSVPQMVFEGDSLRMQCEGTHLPESSVYWSFNGEALNMENMLSMAANSTSNLYKSIITGWLDIKMLNRNHTGFWNCTVTSDHGSESRMVQLMVIKSESVYCEEDLVENNRGAFQWQPTISGVTKNMACPTMKVAKLSDKRFMAHRRCAAGNWTFGNYSVCSYENQVSNLVDKVLKLSPNSGNIVQTLRHLLMSVGNEPIVDPLTVKLISNLMIKVMSGRDRVDNIEVPLLNLAGYVMKTNGSVLQNATDACAKILEVVRNSTMDMKSAAYASAKSTDITAWKVVLDEKKKLSDRTDGITCVMMSKGNLEFDCGMPKTTILQPSISLPKTLLDSCSYTEEGYTAYFIAHRNGSLFRVKSLSENSSNIISDNMVMETVVRGCDNLNLSDPIVYNFKTTKPGSHYAAVWTSKGWVKTDSCSVYCINKNFTQVVCHEVAIITLIYDPESSTCNYNLWSLEDLAHPAVFAGTAVLTACLILVILSYICCSSKMRMSTESRHMLVNICIHLLVASSLFAFCLRRVDYNMVCITTGVVLHYASLAVLLWITLNVRNIHRELLAHTRPPSLEPKPPRPMLRFYLIGCGIPIVICGITVAAKWQNYSGDDGDYCWLSWETSVFAFYIPAALIAVVCIILLIRVLCAFTQHSMEFDSPRSPLARPSWQNNSRVGTERYHAISTGEGSCHVYPGRSTNTLHGPMHRHVASFQPSRINDQSYKTQLCGIALFFVFYILTWVSAALSIAAPNMQKGTQQTGIYTDYRYFYKKDTTDTETSLADVFAYVYAIMAVIMGIFTVLQHLACRKDVRIIWGFMFTSCLKSKDGYQRNRGGRSQTSSNREESDNRDGIETSSGKCSLSGNKKRNGAYTTIKTDPTLETILTPTDNAENEIIIENQPANGTIQNSCSGYHQEVSARNNSEEAGRPAKSVTSIHSSCVMRCPDHSHSQLIGSAGHPHSIPHPYSHEHYPGVNSRGHVPHGYHGFHNHHIPHQQHNKPVKMTNLHMAHDSSMTEYSFDEHAHNNMHTIPVILQHRSQAKVHNAAVNDRYQKVRRALERKRAKQKKLNVLREYAQDPLTSNDEERDEKDSKSGNVNESSPLIQSSNVNGGVNNSTPNGAPKYRPLLLSPSTKKRQETSKTKNGGPAKRPRRLDSSGQARQSRAEKRAKQSMRRSHNSTLSERERDTTSSEKTFGSPISKPSKNRGLNPTLVDSPKPLDSGRENHGYLTLQQLQSANPFLFQSQPAQSNETTVDTSVANYNPLGDTDQVVSNMSLNSSHAPQRNETSV